MLNETEMPVANLDQYKVEIAERLGQLEVEEAKGLVELYGTPGLITIGKIIGPEVSQVLAEGLNEMAQAVAQQQQQQPTPAAPADMPAQMQQAGLA